MKPLYIIEEAIQALRSNALRSFLTIIGIVVGIFSVTAMLGLGQGLSNNILERFSAFSSGDINVSGALTLEDFNWIKSQQYVASAVGAQTLSSVKVIADNTSFSPSVKTEYGDYEKVASLKMVSGKAFDFTDPNVSDHVALVDEGFVDAVKTKNNIDISSGVVSLNGQQFAIIGVTKAAEAVLAAEQMVILSFHTKQRSAYSQTQVTFLPLASTLLTSSITR